MKQRLLPHVDKDELPRKHKKRVGKLQTFTEGLLEEIYAFEDRVGRFNDEVAILKGEKKRPVFKSSRMHEEAEKADSTTRSCKMAKRHFMRKRMRCSRPGWPCRRM